MVTENQVFISKPLGDRAMLITDVKMNGDKTVYSATIVDYRELTVSNVIDEEENCLWLTEWWSMVTKEDAWEEEIDAFSKCMKLESAKLKEKHDENVAKDKDFFQSIIGNTYKQKWGTNYILIRSFYPVQHCEYERRYEMEITCVDCEGGEIRNGERIFTHSEISTCFEPCCHEEFENAVATAQKTKADKLRNDCLAIWKKIEN